MGYEDTVKTLLAMVIIGGSGIFGTPVRFVFRDPFKSGTANPQRLKHFAISAIRNSR